MYFSFFYTPSLCHFELFAELPKSRPQIKGGELDKNYKPGDTNCFADALSPSKSDELTQINKTTQQY